MKRNILPFYALVLSILLAVGCAVPDEDDGITAGYMGGGSRGGDDQPDGEISSEHNCMAIVEYDSPDFSDPDVIAKYAQAKVVIFVPNYLWGPNAAPDIISNMKGINPELKVLGYFNAQTSWLNWADSNPETQAYTYAWHQATSPYWSYSTEGDTMMAWPGKVLLNILEEDCRNAMVDVLAEQWAENANVFDGIFWDHFNTQLWVANNVEGCFGEVDLDGDGIAHQDDEDEMQAYRDASTALVQRVSSVLGSDIIQVTNGNRAARDSVFAGLVDGMMYERFPEVGFGGDEMRNALSPDVNNNLFAARNWPKSSNGGPFLILTNKHSFSVVDDSGDRRTWFRAEFNRVVALLTDTQVTYHPTTQEHSYGWPEVEVHLGAPLGGVTIDGDIISREFENGRVELDFDSGNSTIPFNFQIEQSGQVVQQMRYVP